jgi:hypothetical protein
MDLRMPPLPTLRRRDVVPHCSDVNVRVGRRHVILAKISRKRRRVRTGFRCAATCRELTPPLKSNEPWPPHHNPCQFPEPRSSCNKFLTTWMGILPPESSWLSPDGGWCSFYLRCLKLSSRLSFTKTAALSLVWMDRFWWNKHYF